MRWMLAVVALGACGRISFEPLGGGAGIGDAGIDTADGGADAAPDAPPLPCTLTDFDCPAGSVTTCGTSCIVSCNASMTWTEARDLCLAWGGDLARVDLAADLACLANEINDAWIALVQDPAATPGAGWRWTHGGPLGFTAWLPGEPDDFDNAEDGQAQCGLFSSGGWIDDDCALTKSVACSRPAP